MPNELEHKLSINEYRRRMRKAAKENDGVLAIICAFYVSVHCLEWYFSKQYRYHPKSHVERRNKLSRCLELDSITDDYSELYNLSIDVRYQCKMNILRPENITFAINTVEKIETLLKRIDRDFPFAANASSPLSLKQSE